MADLNLSTVELTSTLRTAPLNGAPSSSDYNSGQRETLVDLATIVSFINNQVLPLINALPDTALQPTSGPVGVEGRTIWSDTSDQSNLFYDALGATPLTLADSLRVLNGMLTTVRQQLTDVNVEVASLQARLASTNQNDIALALQNLTSSVSTITINGNVSSSAIADLQFRATTLEADVISLQSQITTLDNSLGLLETSLGKSLFADISGFIPGLYTDGQKLIHYNVRRVFTLNVDLGTDAFGNPGAKFTCETAPAADATLLLFYNGVQVGTVLFSTGVKTGVVTMASPITTSMGDSLDIYAPTVHDTTMTGVAFTVTGTRSLA